MVWTPYEFWTDGKTSHCGIDVFEMMKDQGAKIANMMWTVEPDACAALGPPTPSRASARPARGPAGRYQASPALRLPLFTERSRDIFPR